MQTAFLSEDQRRSYRRYAGEPAEERLSRSLHLDDEDRRLVAARRGDYNRFDFALQLVTAGFVGMFLRDQTEVSGTAVTYVGRTPERFSRTAATGHFGDTHYENCSSLPRFSGGGGMTAVLRPG